MPKWTESVKEYREQPVWLREALREVRVDAGDRLPIVIWHQKGRNGCGTLVVLRFADFHDWFGD